MSQTPVEKDYFLADIRTELRGFLDQAGHAQAVFISSLDGHLIYDISPEQLDVDQLTAMASAMIGLADSLAFSLAKGQLRDVITRTEEATFIATRIGNTEDALVFGIIAGPQANLGMLLSLANSYAEKILNILEHI